MLGFCGRETVRGAAVSLSGIEQNVRFRTKADGRWHGNCFGRDGEALGEGP